MAVTKTASEQLARIKKNISTAYMYFDDNYKRYREFRKYVFKESINEQQRAVLQQLNRPVVEFNILEAYISRLLGEFSQHEPGIEVSPAEGIPVDQQVLDVVEGHLRHILHDANKANFAYEIYKDLLSGGFSVAKVWTDYASPMSFNQQIYLARVFDPTMCGFDPMARDSHKGDGQFSFEIYPMLEEDFKKEFPDVEIGNVGYLKDIEGFNWSYKDVQGQKIVLVADYYEKKKKKVKIVKLANGRVMTAKNYEKLQEYWQKEQFIEQIPVIVGAPRMTDLETICCYKLFEDQILAYAETDYSYLPHVFVDGNSILLTQGTANTTYQMTRPYVYHAKGIQDMMNYSGQTICNSMENLIQHKYIVMKEAIPQEQDYIDALTDIQRAGTIVVNAFNENNPDQPIPNPITNVQNIPLPPEVMASFQVTGQLTQAILGSFVSNQNKDNQNLSGKAVIESASADNAAAMPYVTGYLAGLNQIANVIVDLIPKYVNNKRVIPVENKAGDKTYQEVNSPGKTMIAYDEKAIKVNVDAGLSFQVQKSQAMSQIVALMGASEEFAKFMNSEQGLKVLSKNLTMYGAAELQEAIPQWIQQQQQAAQQAQQQQAQMMQNDPRMIKAQADAAKVQADVQIQQMKAQMEQMRLEMEVNQQEIQNQIDMARLQIDKEIASSKILEAEAKVTQSQVDSSVRLMEQETSHFNHEIDAATKIAEIHSREHDKAIDRHASHLAETKLNHEMEQANKVKPE